MPRFFIILAILLIPAARLTAADDNHVNKAQIQSTFDQLPLYFIENKGQIDCNNVAYYVKGVDKTLNFTSEGITFALTEKTGSKTKHWIVKLKFVDANPDVKPIGKDKQQAAFSYFKGKEENWKTGLTTYRWIVYKDLWPGIDLIYSGKEGMLKYEFVVMPGADPKIIRLRYRGVSDVSLTDTGALRVDTPCGCFEDGVPFAYQWIQGERRAVFMQYALGENNGDDAFLYGFEVSPFDRDSPLVLDPALLIYCGYLGGVFGDTGLDIAVDEEGNAFITGYTYSPDFPVKVGPDLTLNGGNDAFIAKVNAQGTDLVYCGVIGGKGNDQGYGVCVDDQGNAYVTGFTTSHDDSFPVKVGPDVRFNGWEDSFIAKVNAQGTDLVYCGYIGGSAKDQGCAVAVDLQGHAYITGFTGSPETSFPVKVGPDLTFNGKGDAFAAKVNAQGTDLVYCGYIGGDFYENAFGIAVDAGGHAYITGGTSSSESTFPVKVGPDLTSNGGLDDAFIAKVNAQGTDFDYCGYIGGGDMERGYGVSVDEQENAYVGGFTRSDESSFPVKIGPDLTYNDVGSVVGDGFVAKVNAKGTGLDYCGYIGGADYDQISDIASGKWNSVYVVGWTISRETSFPVKSGPDLSFNGIQDAFVARVEAQGRWLDYCGYIGGGFSEWGHGIAVDSRENIYVSGEVISDEVSFPVKKGPDLSHNGTYDAFAARVSIALVADPLTLSESTGGMIQFFLNAGIESAGRGYLLVGGISGVSPGTSLPGGTTVLPLNWDLFTNLVLGLVNTPLFQDFMGMLDGEGAACAQMSLPPMTGSAGTMMYFAYALNKPFDFASNPVGIEIVQ